MRKALWSWREDTLRTMRKRLLGAALLFAAPLCAVTRIEVLHFSDYHSHALPFYSEDRADQGGLARAIGYLAREHRKGALVFDGGDMVNKGSPAWSDKYQCDEWPWLNGIVDAMAFGNHDPDYGPEAFERCRAALKVPVLSANTAGFEGTAVFTRKGVRIGVFAIAGSDFASLTKNFSYTDRIAAARAAVAELRKKADAVIMIGHETTSDDYELARAVPGIDLILGTHSHYRQELTRIEGTETWFISPYQYLTYISRVELTFTHGRLTGVSGRLVPVDAGMKADKAVAARIAKMQRELETDPEYAALFEIVAHLPQPMTVGELGNLAVVVMRDASRADLAISTASSFRQPLPPGALSLETLRAALPYDNEIVIGEVSGATLSKMLHAGKEGSGDRSSFITPAGEIDPAKTYRVATTDYLARISSYREFFTGEIRRTGLHVREELRKRLAK